MLRGQNLNCAVQQRSHVSREWRNILLNIRLTVAPGGPIGTGNACRISSTVAPCEWSRMKMRENQWDDALLNKPQNQSQPNTTNAKNHPGVDNIYLCCDEHLPTRQTRGSRFPLAAVLTLKQTKTLCNVQFPTFCSYLLPNYLHLHLHRLCPPEMTAEFTCELKNISLRRDAGDGPDRPLYHHPLSDLVLPMNTWKESNERFRPILAVI